MGYRIEQSVSASDPSMHIRQHGDFFAQPTVIFQVMSDEGRRESCFPVSWSINEEFILPSMLFSQACMRIDIFSNNYLRRCHSSWTCFRKSVEQKKSWIGLLSCRLDTAIELDCPLAPVQMLSGESGSQTGVCPIPSTLRFERPLAFTDN